MITTTDETSFQSAEQIIQYLKQRIDEHEIARFIAIFDHYSHTASLQNGQMDERILNALNIVFCFGITLPSPQTLAVRPRSIGVAELEASFVITFMEAPMPLANVAIESWVKAIKSNWVDESRSAPSISAQPHG